MPRPTPHGRKAGKTPGFKPAKKSGPKSRWSSEQRAAQGRNPRKAWEPRSTFRDERSSDSRGRDERPRDDRFADTRGRDERSERRPEGPRTADTRGRNFEQTRPAGDERRGYSAPREGGFAGRAPRKFERDERPSRDDRGGREDRFQRPERRDDRRDERRDDRFGDRGPRKEYASRPVRNEPPARWEPRAERKPWDRPERPRRDERTDRPRFERDDKPRSERDDKPRFERDDKPLFQRDDKPRHDKPRFERDDKPRFERDDKPRFQRDDKPRFQRDDKPRFDRDDKPRYQRDDRTSRPEPRFNKEFREDRPFSEDPDQMSWTATDLGDIDESGVVATEGFAALGVPSIMVAALDKQGITAPFPIQAATIPDAIAGRDVLGRGQTGSGKTLGFGLPMLTRISQAESTGGAPRGLVLVPTRELALQCADVLAPLAKTLRLDLTLIAGGMGYGPQLRAFERGVDIVVATPGRLIDLLEQGAVDLSQVLVTVLDEADHMADLGFMPAVTTLMDTVPADGQRLLFSATLDHAVDRIVKKYLHDPVTHEVDSSRASVSTMEHQLLHVLPHDKNAVTAEVANRDGRSVLFVRTQMGANRVAEQLRGAGVMAGALHGGLTQGARTRILAAFKDGTVPVLVATDVAARGIHVDDVSLVLEVDPPMSSKDYLHRAGRTARAGEKGVVASIVLPHQRKTMARLVGQAGVKVDPLPVRPGAEELSKATGARVCENSPIEDAEYERLIAPKRGGGPRKSGGYQGNRGGGGYQGNRGGGGYRGQGGGGRRFGGDRDRGNGGRGGFQGNRSSSSDRGGNEGWRRER